MKMSLIGPAFLVLAGIAGMSASASALTGGAATPGTSALIGTIADSSGRPIAKAQIYALDSTARTVTDPVGQFALHNLRSGANRIGVRAIGYSPVEFTVDLAPGETRHATITLRTVATRLTAVIVNEMRPHQILRELGFYDRASSTRGTFITPEILQRRHAALVSDVLRGVNGVRLNRSNTGVLPFSAGGYASIGSSNVCLMNLYIDGSRVEIGSAIDQFGPMGDPVMARAAQLASISLDDVIPANDIGAIEIFPSGVSGPEKYSGVSRGCGTILIWTKTKLELEARDSTAR
jgi:hypothetical protein